MQLLRIHISKQYFLNHQISTEMFVNVHLPWCRHYDVTHAKLVALIALLVATYNGKKTFGVTEEKQKKRKRDKRTPMTPMKILLSSVPTGANAHFSLRAWLMHGA